MGKPLDESVERVEVIVVCSELLLGHLEGKLYQSIDII